MGKRKIGVVVHGPEIIDSGWAKKIIDLLSKYGVVKAKLGGTMGRTAVIDASLENEIDITERLKPSESVKKLSCEVDELYILNYGKSRKTGHAFGRLVMSHVGKIKIPIIQIERPGDSDGTIIPWTEGSKKHALKIAKDLKLSVVRPPKIENPVKREKGTVYRKISGVFPGEHILMNGVVIGKANSVDIEIVAKNNKISKIRGGDIKEHGLEKLGNCKIEDAIVKTGTLRRTKRKPRVLKREKSGKAVIIDHIAESSFEIGRNADCAVTIGDDTTDIAGDILYRLGIPIIGITDGDIDNITSNTYTPPGSLIIKLKSGTDDQVGNEIKEKIFLGKNSVDLFDIEDLKNQILKIAEGKVKEIKNYP